MGVRVPTRAVNGSKAREGSNNSLWTLCTQKREVKRPEAVHPYSSSRQPDRWSMSTAAGWRVSGVRGQRRRVQRLR